MPGLRVFARAYLMWQRRETLRRSIEMTIGPSDSVIQVRLARKSRTITYWIIRVSLRHASRRALPGSHYPDVASTEGLLGADCSPLRAVGDDSPLPPAGNLPRSHDRTLQDTVGGGLPDNPSRSLRYPERPQGTRPLPIALPLDLRNPLGW